MSFCRVAGLGPKAEGAQPRGFCQCGVLIHLTRCNRDSHKLHESGIRGYTSCLLSLLAILLSTANHGPDNLVWGILLQESSDMSHESVAKGPDVCMKCFPRNERETQIDYEASLLR